MMSPISEEHQRTSFAGSTLAHKLLLGAGVCSLTEPQWVDQLCKGRASREASDAALRRAVRACVLLDCALAAKSAAFASSGARTEALRFSINPKSGGYRVQKAVAEAWPASRHIFMYRACDEVVESFGSIFRKDHPPSTFETPLWRAKVALGYAPPPPPRLARIPGLADALGSLSSGLAARGVAGWTDAVLGYLEVARPAIAAHHNGEAPLQLRFDELTDAEKRTEVVARLLGALGIAEGTYDQDAVVAVFGKDSQAGSKMSRIADASKKKVKVLTAEDKALIKDRCLPLAFGDKLDAPKTNGSATNGAAEAAPLVHFDQTTGDFRLL